MDKNNTMNAIKFFLLLVFAASVTTTRAQKVTVEAKTEKVRGEQAPGAQTELNAPLETVTTSWNKYLKDVGKSKSQGEYAMISAPVLGTTVYDKGIVYTKVQSSGTSAKVWIGLIESEWAVNDISVVQKELEQLVYRFGVKFYRDQIQLQIDEAQQAVEAVERSQQRLANQNKDFTNKLTTNEAEKVRLEKLLENNQLEHAALLTRLENNRKAQDSVAAAMIPIKKVLEMHQERQRKVN
jgi:hypothetical protein